MNFKVSSIVVFVALSAFVSVSGLRCYDCDGDSDSKNKCLGKPNKDHIGDCDRSKSVYQKINGTYLKVPQDSLDHTRQQTWRCYKYYSKQGKTETVNRGCIQKLKEECNQCMAFEVDGMEGANCFCDADECNSALSVSKFTSLVFLGLILFSLFL